MIRFNFKPDFGDYWAKLAGDKPINMNLVNFRVFKTGNEPETEAQITWTTDSNHLGTICVPNRLLKRTIKEIRLGFVEIYADQSDAYYDKNGLYVVPFKLTKSQLAAFRSPYKSKRCKTKGFGKAS